jgi:signal transduction histidine kinase/CheY-like chemotaxis protein
VVLARQRAHQVAELLKFDSGDQARIATAVSEIARNVYRYARDGKAEYMVEQRHGRSWLTIRIADTGPGIKDLQSILDGRYVSSTGLGLGITGARRLVDDFEMETSPAGTRVLLRKELPRDLVYSEAGFGQLVESLAKRPSEDPFDEVQRQNQELLATLNEVQMRKDELAQLNKELEDTNRGVLALYAELDERAAFLRRASEMKTQFLSNMSHEFRTPLNSITSLTRILLDRLDGPLTEEQAKQVTFVQKSANDLSELVNDLLDLAKVEAGKVVVRPAEFNVQDLFGALRGVLKPLTTSNSAVALVFEEPDREIELETDENRLSQILRNLVSNALKFTPQGEVRVRFDLTADDKAEFSVSDTGIGIALEDQERIFEEFTQVEGRHQEGKKGTGLGLPLSRKLAELLGGTLTIQSEPGKGSVFTLRIPRDYGSHARNTVPEALVIDDDEASRYILSSVASRIPLKMIEATNGIQGLKEARERHPAVIFLDIMMPGMDGFEVLEALKNDPETRSIPVIIHTSRMLTPAERQTLQGAAIAILQKDHTDQAASERQIRAALEKAGKLLP